ncbi:MAG: hypothetical protein K1X53_17365 [Candidatus Sumerlaeaceae bacterium]|nr:hypothetical protein [Candidatus Sumerlaeaceae bacterium]
MIMASGSISRLNAGVIAETHDLLSFEYQQVGANEEEAVRLAGIRAVKAAIGRQLLSDYSLQARDLLEPYIQRRWQNYIASSYVLERRFERDGFGCRIRVQVMPDVLFRDLREKKFLYLPHSTPYVYVHVVETLDGQPSPQDLGRRAIQETVASGGGKIMETSLYSLPPGTDVLSSPEALTAARELATRASAEIIVAGRLTTKKVDEKKVLYEDMVTFETRLELAAIRTDDGSLVGSADAVQRSSDLDAATARDNSIRLACERAVTQIAEHSRNEWRKTYKGKSKFDVMFTDLSDREAITIQRHLESYLGHGTKAYLRSLYGNVAVFALDTDRDFSALERAIVDFKSFDLRITDRQGRRITVDVKH